MKKHIEDFVRWAVKNDKIDFPDYYHTESPEINTLEDMGIKIIDEYIFEHENIKSI